MTTRLLKEFKFETKPQAQKFDFLDAALTNRIKIWELSSPKQKHYLALAHLPFRQDEEVNDKNLLSPQSVKYNHMIQEIMACYKNENFMLCADFNSNPYFISEHHDRAGDQITHNNSVILKNESTKNVTVDGILNSMTAKQKFFSKCKFSGLFFKVKKELELANSNVTLKLNKTLINNLC